MKKFAFLTLSFTLGLFAAIGQQYITGSVVNKLTKEPVPGSSVFISNTSRGTTTDKQGNFSLQDIPTGKYDLIVSSIGYETSVYSFNSEDLPLKLRFELDVRVRELDNVTVEPSIEEGWDKWGLVFTENFIGLTPNAAECKIKNIKAIHFRYYRKSNRLIAYADEPLIIENRALGFRINYQMENFEVNFKNNSSAFAGYPLFSEMNGEKKAPRPRWEHAREKAYYGSMMHFMRSVYSNKLQEEGFDVRRMRREPNLERERVKEIVQHLNLFSQGSIRIGNADSASHNNSAIDSSEYYQRIMHQKDYIEIYAKSLLTADSLVAETQGGFKIIYFTDYLYVTYKKELEDPAYLAYYRENRKPMYQQSYVWLTSGSPIAIDQNGSYFPPSELFSMAYWGWSEKIADMIPIDYTADK